MITPKSKGPESVTEGMIIDCPSDRTWLEASIKRIESYMRSTVDGKGFRGSHYCIYVRLNFAWRKNGSPLALDILAKKYKDAGWEVETGYESVGWHEGMSYIKLF